MSERILILAPWGSPVAWDEIIYEGQIDDREIRVKSCTSLSLIYEYLTRKSSIDAEIYVLALESIADYHDTKSE